MNERDVFERDFYSRGQVRGSLTVWAEAALSEFGYTPATHHRFLLTELERLSSGAFDRLMILMPPGSAKSTYASVLFPVWWFTQHPKSSIITASHSSSLASHFSRRVRSLILANETSLGFNIARQQRSFDSWSTTTGGDYFAVGVRGAIAGRRADLIIVDDPIRSQADAESSRQRDFIWDWFRADLSTRLRPGGKVVLIMTRWHPEDLGGQLLARAKSEWRVIRLPALAEANDPLGRSEGAALWPEWEGKEALMQRRDLIGQRAWSALFQQDPHPAGGKLFSIDHLSFLSDNELGAPKAAIRAWDLAATGATGQNDPDWTVGIKLVQQHNDRYVVVDVARIRGTPRQVEELVVSTARRDGTKVIVAIPEDPGQAGKSQMAYLTRQLAGFHVVAARETGAKATRAMPLASQVEAGNIAMLRASWNQCFVDEFRDFPFGRKDDQVDALVRAFTTLSSRSFAPRAITLPTFNR